jgi:DNA-binding NarL/FixJ family response regulator
MGKKIKLLIADDHPLMLNGLRQVFDLEDDFEVIEATNGEDALELIRKQKPDVAILDVEMPNKTGFDVAKQAHYESLSVDIIFLTMYNDEIVFNKAMDIGVKGFVLKENTVSEIVKCVRTVADGKYYLSPVISEYLLRRNTRLAPEATDKYGIDLLTETERKIMKQLTLMKTSQEIADYFNVSIKTVQNHRNNICNKLGLSGAHALLKYALNHEKRW